MLGTNTVLGHAIIVGGSSWTNYPAGDVRIMADAGCSVAHAVWVFARRGVLMESFARYKAAGVNIVAVDVASFSKPVVSTVVGKFESKWGKGTYEKLQAIK